jgi:prevent-host-death family protein
MKVVSFSEARNKLKALCDEVRASHKPVHIHRRGGDDVVIVSADDWEAMEETLHIASIPGASERLRNPGDFKALTPFSREAFDQMIEEERRLMETEAEASNSV